MAPRKTLRNPPPRTAGRRPGRGAASARGTTRRPHRRLVVSVVVYQPNLAHLTECLESVLASPVPGLELHVVDNSPLPLGEALMAPLRGRLVYHHGHGNVGFGAGHNRIIHALAAEADYYLVLNPDTHFEPTLLPTLLARMDADPTVGLCIPRIVYPDGRMQYVNKLLPTPAIMFLRPFLARIPTLQKPLEPWMRSYLLQHFDLTRPLTCPFISGCFMFFRGAVLAGLGGFDKRYFMYSEDADLSRRAATVGRNVVFSDLRCVHYWERAAYQNPKLFGIMAVSAIKYFNKWGWLIDQDRWRLNAMTGYYTAPAKARQESGR